MAPLLLRKKKQAQAQKPEPKSSPPLRHSLSLPDLTTPLLDPASWEDLPPPTSPITPSSPNDQSSPLSPRPRKTSIINHGSPVQFHRPFTPWQVVVNPDSPPQDDRVPGDFRTSRARWGRDSTATGKTQKSSLSSMGGLGVGMGGTGWKKRAKSKAMGRLNVVVVGSKGVGKTSFIQLMIDSLQTGPKSVGPDVPPILEAEETRQTAIRGRSAPTTRVSAKVVHVSEEMYDRTILRLIDTPGVSTGPGVVEEKERERGVAGLLRIMEDGFGSVMREESRIVRRATRGEDDLIHLVLYLVDARSVLHPAAAAPSLDWSAVGVFGEPEEPVKSDVEGIAPAIPPADVDVIRRLSQRANVLPILAHADSLSLEELDSVRSAVRNGLASLPGAGFGIFGEEDEADRSKTPTPDHTALGEGGAELRYPRPPTPASTIASENGEKLPYAVFCPEVREAGKFVRRFAWGDADVMSPDQSDFAALRDAILDTHLKILRSATREVLYEQYRTERLLEQQKTTGTRNDRLSE